MAEEISAQLVKELRERTGAGVMECRKALLETGGNLAKAEAVLKEKAMSRGPKDPSRATKQGLVESYKHPNGQLGSLVELNCETDFVARTEDFRTLAYEIALHVAATGPTYLERAAIPQADLEKQRAAIAEQVQLAGAEATPADLEARLEHWILEVALLEQPYVRDAKTTVRELIRGVAAKTGENIRVGRFARFRIGE